MLSETSFTVPGRPVPFAKQRFIPGRQARHMKAVAWAARIAMKAQAPTRGPVSLALTFLRSPTEAQRKSGVRTYDVSPKEKIAHRGDASNLTKLVEDALQGIVYVDDAQIVDLSVALRLTPDGVSEQTLITVRELG